jgi:hypothetical protein
MLFLFLSTNAIFQEVINKMKLLYYPESKYIWKT